MELKRRKSVDRALNSVNGHHWAARCKLECAKEFGEKGIPLQENADAASRKEMDDLESFFGMSKEEFEGKYRKVMDFAASAFMSTINKAPISSEEATLKVKGKLWEKINAKRMAKSQSATEETPASPKKSLVEPKLLLKLEPKLPLGSMTTPASASSSAMSPSASTGLPSPSSLLSPCSKGVPTTPGSLRSRAASANDQPQVPRRTRGISLCDVLTQVEAVDHSLDASEGTPAQARFGQSARARIHQPVTPRELVLARPPSPLSIGDFPPIFQRTVERPQESHYCYFSRRIPEESPAFRKVMELRANSTKRQFGWRELPSVGSEASNGTPRPEPPPPPPPPPAMERASTEPRTPVCGPVSPAKARGRTRTDNLAASTSARDSTLTPRPTSRPPTASPCPSVIIEKEGKTPSGPRKREGRSVEPKLPAKR